MSVLRSNITQLSIDHMPMRLLLSAVSVLNHALTNLIHTWHSTAQCIHACKAQFSS